jgi:glycosyltransferase involved in cell wall biosynthesis
LKIVVVGTRGIPNILGGVETHCQNLYPKLIEMGCEVTVVTRASYVVDKSVTRYEGVRLKHIFVPKIKSLEAIIHTFLAVIYAWRVKANIIHIHAVGPALFTPLAKLLKMKVVFTHHGADYERNKWGKVAKWFLKRGELHGIRSADRVIVISKYIRDTLLSLYPKRHYDLIYNGIVSPNKNHNNDYLKSLELKKEKYIIAVGRFVEEKGFHDLIKAFEKANLSDIKLVLVGDADHETEYSLKLKQAANQAGVILTGFISGEKLNQIYSNARIFVLPSYHEGLPIALLEAMSYGLAIIASDIPANKEVELDNISYFKVKDSGNYSAP